MSSSRGRHVPKVSSGQLHEEELRQPLQDALVHSEWHLPHLWLSSLRPLKFRAFILSHCEYSVGNVGLAACETLLCSLPAKLAPLSSAIRVAASISREGMRVSVLPC